MGAPGIPPLPTPQLASPNIQPRMGDRGAFIPNAPGTLPYRDPVGAQVASGIASFVQSYLAGREGMKEHYKQKFYDSVQQMAAGIPLDPNEVVKYAQKGGIPIRTEPETPEEKNFKQAAAAQTAATAMQMQQPGSPEGSMMYGTGAIPNAASMPPPQQPAPPQEPQRSMMDKFLGRYPQAQPGSPMLNWLGDVSAASQVGGGLPGEIAQQGRFQNIDMRLKQLMGQNAEMDTTQKQGMMNLMKGVMANDQVSNVIASHLGLAKIPAEEATELVMKADPTLNRETAAQKAAQLQLWLTQGGPQMSMKMMQMAKEDAGRFGGNAATAMRFYQELMHQGASQLTPSYTPEELEKVYQSEQKLLEAYPNAPANIIHSAVASELSNTTAGKDFSAKVQDYLSQHWPRNGTLEQKRFDARLGQDYSRLALESEIQHGDLELKKLHTIIDTAGSQGENAWKIMNDKNATPQQREAGMNMLANAASRMSGLTVKYNGQNVPIQDPMQVVKQWTAGRSLQALNPFSPVPFSDFFGAHTPMLAPPGGNAQAFGPGQPPNMNIQGGPQESAGQAAMRIQRNIQGMTPEEFKAVYGRFGSNQTINAVANWLQQRRTQQDQTQPQDDDNQE